MRSAAKGENIYRYYRMLGRVQLDMMNWVKDNIKPESNALRFAAEMFLGVEDKIENVTATIATLEGRALAAAREELTRLREKDARLKKRDLPIEEMFKLWDSDDPRAVGACVAYGIRDAILPILIAGHLDIVPNTVEMLVQFCARRRRCRACVAPPPKKSGVDLILQVARREHVHDGHPKFGTTNQGNKLYRARDSWKICAEPVDTPNKRVADGVDHSPRRRPPLKR